MSSERTVEFDIGDAQFRRLAKRVIDMMQEALDAERTGPVLRLPSGPDLRAALDQPLPRAGRPVEELLEVWRTSILPYARRNGHARMFGYVVTSADPIGMLADALASALNQGVTAWRSAPSATEVERLAVRWLAELTGFGGSGGSLVSGGSSANLHGLACAVSRAEARAGLRRGSRDKLAIYMTAEAHVSQRKAARLLGVPDENVRLVAVDDQRRMSVAALRTRIRADHAGDLVPAAVCASAGTANTGAIDPLTDIADVCAEHGLWLHIDGSYGAPAVLAPAYSWMRAAFARADSLSLDPHKWLFAPVDAGCILVRDEGAELQAFRLTTEYTAVSQTNEIERYAAFDRGIEMTRRFRGLKVWMLLAARGVDAIAEVIAGNIGLREQLDARVAAEPRLEALGSELSISCFRYVPEADDPATREAQANEVNRLIVDRLIADGGAYMSPTTLNGRYSLRVCIVNFRTRAADIHWLIDETVRLGREIETGL